MSTYWDDFITKHGELVYLFPLGVILELFFYFCRSQKEFHDRLKELEKYYNYTLKEKHYV